MHENDLKGKAAFLSMAQAHLDQSRFTEALDLAESWLKEHSMDADAIIVSCHALMRLGKLNRVEKVLARVDDAILQLSRIYSFMGDMCRESGLSREAIRFYRKFISINPGSTDTGEIMEKLRSLMAASEESPQEMEEEHYDTISNVASDFYTVTLADLYIRQGYLQMAVDVLNEILKADGGNHQAAEKLSQVNAMLRDKRQKEELVRELTRWLNNMDRIRCHAS
jgi:tetratricopeptide (TPR) repeat protein